MTASPGRGGLGCREGLGVQGGTEAQSPTGSRPLPALAPPASWGGVLSLPT